MCYHIYIKRSGIQWSSTVCSIPPPNAIVLTVSLVHHKRAFCSATTTAGPVSGGFTAYFFHLLLFCIFATELCCEVTMFCVFLKKDGRFCGWTVTGYT